MISMKFYIKKPIPVAAVKVEKENRLQIIALLLIPNIEYMVLIWDDYRYVYS